MNDVQIRPITLDDAAGFRDAVDAVARERRYLRRFEGPSVEGATAFVKSNIETGNPQFVALSSGRVVGWCDIVRGTEDGEAHRGEMGMGVIMPWRGRGIGRKLLEATLAAADAAKILRTELSVHSDNDSAIALYRRLGFVEEGRLRAARLKDDGYVDVLVMARLDPMLAAS